MPAETPWQDYFTDAGLRKLIAIALENNRDLRVAVLQIERPAPPTASSAPRCCRPCRRAAAAPPRTPAGLSSSGAATVSHEYTATLGTSSYELDLFGRVRSLEGRGAGQLPEHGSGAPRGQITLVANVASAYGLGLRPRAGAAGTGHAGQPAGFLRDHARQRCAGHGFGRGCEAGRAVGRCGPGDVAVYAARWRRTRTRWRCCWARRCRWNWRRRPAWKR